MAFATPRRRRARSEVLWTAGSFLAATCLFVAGVEIFFPEWYDREYEVRRELLKNRVAEQPGRPIVMAVGSSRFVVDFMPERLGPIVDDRGRQALVFNYSHFGAGPRMNTVQVHRAIRDGVKPTHIVLELVPGFLAHDDLPLPQIALADVPYLWPNSNKFRLAGQCVLMRLNGVYRTRTSFVRWACPDFVTRAENEKEPSLYPLGGDNQWARLDNLTAKDRDWLTRLAVNRFQKRMQNFKVADYLANAMRDLLQLCRDEDIKVAIVLTPEDSQFRSWYRPGAEEELQHFLGEIETTYGVPVVDARRWLADDGFTDPHHLNTQGATEFTRRLEIEVLRPFVGGFWHKR